MVSNNKSQSAWDESLDVLKSVLEPGSKSDAALSDYQREGLKKLRTLLLTGEIKSDKAHIPQSLLPQKKKLKKATTLATSLPKPGALKAGVSRTSSTASTASDGGATDDMNAYFLSEFAGIQQREDARKKFKSAVGGLSFLNKLRARSRSSSPSSIARSFGNFVPKTFLAKNLQQQQRICTMLSWESLGHHAFNIFHLKDLVGQDALVYMGWAILGSPYAQHAMEKVVANSIKNNNNNNNNNKTTSGTNGETAAASGAATSINPLHNRIGYRFLEKYKIPEATLVEFLHAVQVEYKDVPFHNVYHASDVLQSLHALLQMSNPHYNVRDGTSSTKSNGGGGNGGNGGGTGTGGTGTGAIDLWADSSADDIMEVFAVLLAAVIHDVGHPGYNNNFQVNSKSDLALTYNDKSVLENMHAAKGFQLLMGKEKKKEMDILVNFNPEDTKKLRDSVIKLVLSTDMTFHFEKISQVKGYLESKQQQQNQNGSADGSGTDAYDDDETPSALIWQGDTLLLGFVLHAADISNPTKSPGISSQWADRCLEEFFLQGDKERALSLPISPLCDRNTTKKPDSQIGFITFIILPTFELLGQIIPSVGAQIVPRVKNNLNYWKKRKEIEQQKQEQEKLEKRKAAITTTSPTNSASNGGGGKGSAAGGSPMSTS